MLGIIVTTIISISEYTYDPFGLVKCLNSTKGCSATQVVTFFTGGLLSHEEVDNITKDYSEIAIRVLNPNYSLSDIVENNKDVQRFLIITKELSLDKSFLEIISKGDENQLKIYHEKYNELIKNYESYAKIGATKILNKKELIKKIEALPESPENFTLDIFLKSVGMSSALYNRYRNMIIDVLDEHQSVYRAISNITGIKYDTIFNLINSFSKMIIDNCYNIQNFLDINETLFNFVQEAMKVNLVEILSDESVNMSHLMLNFPHLQEIGESILQLCNSFDRNHKQWSKILINVPSKETTEKVRKLVKRYQSGISINEILLSYYGDKKKAKDVYDILSFVLSKSASPEKILRKYLPKDYIKEYRRFMNIMVNKRSKMKDIIKYLNSFGKNYSIPYSSIINLIGELGNQNQSLINLSIFKDYGIDDIVRETVLECQRNLSNYYQSDTPLKELIDVPSEAIEDIIDYLESEPSVKEVLYTLNLSNFVENFFYFAEYVHNSTMQNIETIPSEDLTQILNETALFFNEIVGFYKQIYSFNVSIKQAIEKLPFKNSNEIYPSIISFLNDLNNSLCLKDIAENIDENKNLSFSVVKVIEGFNVMENITIINLARLFVDEDAIPGIKNCLARMSLFAKKVYNMKVSEFFHFLFGVSIKDVEKSYVYINRILGVKYVFVISMFYYDADMFFTSVNNVLAEPDKKYNLDYFDQVLDNFITLATGIKRPEYQSSNGLTSTSVAIAAIFAFILLVFVVAIAVFLLRKKHFKIEEDSEMEEPLV